MGTSGPEDGARETASCKADMPSVDPTHLELAGFVYTRDSRGTRLSLA